MEAKKDKKVCRIGQLTMSIMHLAASNKSLDIDTDSLDDLSSCIGSSCAHWVLDYSREQREGHSGGKQQLYVRGLDTGREVKQIGHDLFVLEEKGHCGFVK